MKNTLPKLKISYNAPVTLTFIFISLIILILNSILGGVLTTKCFSVYRSSLTDPLAYVRMFGHVLGHIDYNHFIANALPILILGPGLEERYGSRTVLFAIFIAAFTSGLFWFIAFPQYSLLGASGIVFMMIMLSTFGNVRDGCIPLTCIVVMVLYVGGEILDAIFAADTVSQTAHIIGALCGTVLGFLLRQKEKGHNGRAA